MWTVIGTETYLSEIALWPKADREIALQLPQKLQENPTQGKPLTYPFLREKRIRERRIYYLIYKDLELVLLVATSGKKDQRATIDHIRDQLDEFKKIAGEIAKRVF